MILIFHFKNIVDDVLKDVLKHVQFKESCLAVVEFSPDYVGVRLIIFPIFKDKSLHSYK